MTPGATARAGEVAPIRAWLLVGVAAVLLLAQGVYYAPRMVTWGDESAYVHLGGLAARGEISLFQDEMRGQRLPLPFYVIGVSQLAAGPSLLAGRLTSLAFGVVALALAVALAGRIGGRRAGLLAGLFVATQGVLIAYYATAVYHALAATILLTGLLLILSARGAGGRTAGIVVLSLLFVTRGSFWPVHLAVVAVLVVVAARRRERLLLVLAGAAVPAAFLLSDPRHLKPLAYVPVLRRLVAPLGYTSVWPFIGRPSQGLDDQLWGIVRLARTYEYWMLAAAVAAALLGYHWARHRRLPAVLTSRAFLAAAGLFLLILLAQIVVYGKLRLLAALFPSFGALVAVMLGVAFSAVFDTLRSTRARRLLVAALVLLWALPVAVVRHPLLPDGADTGVRVLDDLDRAARRIESLVPRDARVFLYGYSLPLYLAGRAPYLRQIHDPNSLATHGPREVLRRNGLWGPEDVEHWLSADADYAVVQPAVLAQFRRTRPGPIARIETLLAAHFERIGHVGEYRWASYDVYRRRGPRQAVGEPPGDGPSLATRADPA